jgi:hypothetical protein
VSSSGQLNSSALLRESARHRGSARSSCLDQAEPLPRIGMPPWPPTMPLPQPEPSCPAFDPVLPPPPEPNPAPPSPRSLAPWTPSPLRADPICLEVHDLSLVLPPPSEPNLAPSSSRSPALWTPPPLRADPIYLEVHELPSPPQQDQVFLELKDMVSTSGCPLMFTMGDWFAWDSG